MLKDVVVIGAGPAGTIIGGTLARTGSDVLIIDKADFPGHKKVCGGAISKSFFEELDLPREIIEKESNKFVVHDPTGRAELSHESGFAIIERERFDTFLAQKAVENGARLSTSTTVTDVTVNSSRAIIHCKKPQQGGNGRVEARLAVFADGAETLAYRTLKIGFQKKPECTLLAAACDLKWKNNSWDSLDFFISEEVSPFGYGWIFPKRDSINVGVTILLSELKQNIRQHLDRLLKLERLESLETTGYGFRLIPQAVAKNMFSDSALVIGDAAGTADPITASGIQNAITNARTAAIVAEKALQNRSLTADLLKGYEKEWKETQCYKRLISKCKLQKMAIKLEINPAIALRMDAF
jgi:digeranylgeranylglycerophospholipid reductase